MHHFALAMLAGRLLLSNALRGVVCCSMDGFHVAAPGRNGEILGGGVRGCPLTPVACSTQPGQFSFSSLLSLKDEQVEIDQCLLYVPC